MSETSINMCIIHPIDMKTDGFFKDKGIIPTREASLKRGRPTSNEKTEKKAPKRHRPLEQGLLFTCLFTNF